MIEVVAMVEVTEEALADVPFIKSYVHEQLTKQLRRVARNKDLALDESTVEIVDLGPNRETQMFAPFAVGDVISDEGDVWDEESQRRWESRHTFRATGLAK